MSKYELNSIETDYVRVGNPADYETELGELLWALVNFDIDGDTYVESVVFECGLRNDVAVWENYKSMMGSDDEAEKFFQDCLQQAEDALIELKKTIAED